jgi:hypothetical protein
MPISSTVDAHHAERMHAARCWRGSVGLESSNFDASWKSKSSALLNTCAKVQRSTTQVYNAAKFREGAAGGTSKWATAGIPPGWDVASLHFTTGRKWTCKVPDLLYSTTPSTALRSES